MHLRNLRNLRIGRSLTAPSRPGSRIAARITNHRSIPVAALIFFFLFPVPYSLFPPLALAQGITPQSIITTVAGGSWQFRGDGKPAVDAPLGVVQGVAVDPSGNILAADLLNHLVVRISPGGILSVVAGNGIQGFSGDGGLAIYASLYEPKGLVIDRFGNIIFADGLRVRKVGPDGAITTIAGGKYGFSGDGGPANNASLTFPNGLTFDSSGNLYIADGNRIRRVDPSGIITTIAGNGVFGFSGDGGPALSASLNFPSALVVDPQGNLYIADTNNGRIRKVSPTGIITTVAALRASGLQLDQNGNLYIATILILKLTPEGIMSNVAGNGGIGFSGDGGPATAASLAVGLFVAGIAFDSAGNLYFADSDNRRIRKVSTDGIITTVAGNGNFRYSGDGGPATSASLNNPAGVAVDGSRNLFILDANNNRIRKVGSDGTITNVAGNGFLGFSGDGGLASEAKLHLCRGLGGCGTFGAVVDATGNLYFSDKRNNRVRKITASGIITTIAGNGVFGFSNDAGPALSASLCSASDLVLDPEENLYIADTGCHRVRKVSASGIIATVAGNAVAGFSGDGGSATSASLKFPSGVALDAVGNLYIADEANHRIRKVSPNGIITTVAGSGMAGFSGDGGPAAGASLQEPKDVALDAGGNLYIADSLNSRIRKVGPDGVITTVAGGGFTFPGDGGRATSAALGVPFGVALDLAGNLYITVSDRIRKVWATAPGFGVSPATLSFRAPAGAPVVAEQRIAVLSEAVGLQWNARAVTESGGSWLTVTPAAGRAPGAIAVGVNVSALEPGTYRGTVTVNAPLANPAIQTVAVTLTVEAAIAPKLVAEPLALTFEAQTGVASLPAKTLRISNGGSGTVEWSARVETSSGGQWLEVSPSSGSVSSGSPQTVQVRALPGSLAAGVYTASIRLSGQVATGLQACTATGVDACPTIPVTLLIAQPTKTILLSQTGLIFTGVEGGRAVPSDTFGIANIGEGEMVWALEATTLSGGANWLTVSPREGRSQAGSLRVPLVEVSVNAAGLRAGQYNGLVRVNAFGAANSPQFTTVTLNVLPPGSNPGVVVRPTGMIFAAQAGTFSPGSQTVRLSTAASGQIEARSGLFTVNGGEWIEILPPNVVLSAEDPRTIVVQPKVEGLAAGVYRGQLALAFSDGSPTQRVDILFLVVAGAISPSRDNPSRDREGAGPLADGRESDSLGPLAYARGSDGRGVEGCSPQRLHAVFRTLTDNFATPTGWPSPIEVQVADDCGAPVTNATVVASFSNGDRPLVLTSLRNGRYVGTWKPTTVRDQVLITVRAEQPPLPGIELRAQGQVRDNPSAPSVSEGGVVNGASFAAGEPVAPGSIISVFGRNLARGENYSPRLPLEKTLGGATLNIGEYVAPLFYSSDGQINAQVPFELTPNTRPHVVVRTTRADGAQALTLPETITIAAARPAIFTTSQQGTGQGAILNQDSSPNSAANAAARGSVVQIFATGLGATNPAVASGSPAPSSPPAQVTNVTVTIGGVTVPAEFAGLAPTFVGLYQVNVRIPANVTPGPEVPVVLLQSGVPSNTVTVAVR